jgi:hypothetical protein
VIGAGEVVVLAVAEIGERNIGKLVFLWVDGLVVNVFALLCLFLL